MAANVILIDPINKRAVSTTLPLKSIKNYTGALAAAPTEVYSFVHAYLDPIKIAPYMILVSDANGRLTGNDVIFNEDGTYYFHPRSAAW